MSESKGDRLNRRVAALFELAGFETKPNSNSRAEHVVDMGSGKSRRVDLWAIDSARQVTIIGSNKSGDWGDSWTGHVSDLQEIASNAKASKVLFVLTGKELSPENREYALNKAMSVWTDAELSYYEAIASAIREYAKFQILHDLGISTKEEKDIYRVLATRVHQPTLGSQTELFMFSISADRLLKTCVVYRRAQGNPKAYQRILRKDRLPKVQSFVSKPEAILPTNLILHLPDQVTVDPLRVEEFQDFSGRPITLSSAADHDIVALNIPMQYASLELIDGQHRLFGFAGCEPATKKSFRLLVAGIKGLKESQRRETFVAINDNSRRMDANLVAYLKYTDDLAACQADHELMAIRVVVELNRVTPFKNQVRLLDVGDQVITLRNFYKYDLKGLLAPRGLLRKYYPGNMPQDYVAVLRMYFSTAKSLFNRQWRNPRKYILPTNRGIAALLKLLRSILRTHKGQPTHKDFKYYLEPLKKGWKTWEIEGLKKTYVGSQGWKEFHRDLIKVIRAKIPDFKE